MFQQAMSAMRRCVVACVGAGVVVVASAQGQHAAQPPAASAVALSANLVKTGLYEIAGGGGNTLMRLSASGLILVDGKLPGNYRALMSQVRKINKLSDLPVRALIITDHHENHAGNSAQFLAAGVAVIAQDNSKPYLPASSAAASGPAITKRLAPVVSYDRDYKLRMGGVEVHLFHFGNAHTGGDTVVLFPDLKVVAVGDLFTPDAPEPDFAAGGSLVGWGPVLGEVLKLDFDIVVPSTGPSVNRAALEAFKARIDTLTSRASALVKGGVSKDQLMARLKTDDLGWRFDLTGERLDRFYAELSQTP